MQDSIDSTRLGVNRTGMQTSPKLSQEMLASSEAIPAPGDEDAIVATRLDYIEDADPLGSVPPPATMKGMAKSGAKMLTGHRPQAFIDKLASDSRSSVVVPGCTTQC